MTAEERAAQFIKDWRHLKFGSADKLEQLVAQAIKDAVADEREACAKIAENHNCEESYNIDIPATIRNRK